MKKTLVFTVTFSIGILLAIFALRYWTASVANSSQSKPMRTTAFMGWLFSGAYAGEALAQAEYAARYGLDLELQPGGPGLDPIRLLRDNTFGIAAADEVIKVVANNNAPLVIIAVLNDETPAAFVSLKSSGIKSPTDFVGKRIGILPFGSTRLIYQALMEKVGIPLEKVKEVVISPDLRSFIAGATHDIQPVYAYDEPVTLSKEGIEYNLIRPSEYGVVFKGPVYFTTKSTIENNRELVVRFIKSTFAGWKAAGCDPHHAINVLASLAPSIDKQRELEVLQRALPYYTGGPQPLFDSDPETWNVMVKTLLSSKIITRNLQPSDFLDLSVLRDIIQNADPSK